MNFAQRHPASYFAAALTCFVCMSMTTVGQATPISLEAVHDNHVLDSAATTVQGSGGTSATLALKEASSNHRKVWTKFDLSSANPDGSMGFTFDFRQTDVATDYTGVFGIWALNTGFTPPSGELGTNWDESALTWNNAPANQRTDTDHERGFQLSAATKLGTIAFDSSDGAGTEYSLTSALPLSNFLQLDDTVTLMIGVDDQSNNSPLFSVASSEHTTIAGPTLTFNQLVPPVPEPSTFALLGGALAGLAVRRRRR